MAFLRNSWYMAAWSSEITKETLVARTILTEPIVFFRDESGMAQALQDRCPHRFAPLGKGKLVAGKLQCPYHGLEFDGKGHCVHNPHGDGGIPKAARVKSYPVHERDMIVWVWMGDADRADTSCLPDFSFLVNAKPTARNTGYLPTRANYQLLCDNIMDLSHADYLHASSLGGGSITRSTAEVTEDGNTVKIIWRVNDDVVPPAFAREMPDPTARANQWTQVVWSPPCALRLSIGVELPDGGMLHPEGLHIMTPETEATTHYFYANTRNFQADNAEYNHIVDQLIINAFSNEDKPMIEAQQNRMGTTDLFALNPVLLSIDAGAVRVRRKLDLLIKLENSP